LKLKIPLWLFLATLTAQAQLAVTVSPPKITGQKAILSLAMTTQQQHAPATTWWNQLQRQIQ
jgi:hypothetical protein